MVGNVLDVSKIEADKLEIIQGSWNIKESIQKIAIMCKTIASNKGLLLKLIFEENIPEYFKFDNSRFSQVLINLISNAIKFTDRGGVYLKVSFIQTPKDISKSNLEQMIINELENSDLELFSQSMNEIPFDQKESNRTLGKYGSRKFKKSRSIVFM